MITLAQLLVSRYDPWHLLTSSKQWDPYLLQPQAPWTRSHCTCWNSLSQQATPIATIFNLSIDKSVFLSAWKIGQVVPVYMIENRVDYVNYRPITLLPSLSKVIEHVVHEQLKCYLEEHHTIVFAQHGYRSKRSCCSALLTQSNNLSTTKNAGLFSAVAALNYTRHLTPLTILFYWTSWNKLDLTKMLWRGFRRISCRGNSTCATMA